MVTEAPRAPVAVGVNVTLIVQFPLFAATELPQLFVWAKSPLFAPVTPMLVMFSAAFPVLVSVTDWGPLLVFNCWLANVKLAADKLTPGAGAPAPVPLSVIVCGLPVSLSVMVTAAARAPVAVGVNVTLMVQFPLFAATELPQLFVCAKSPLFAPVTPMLMIFSAALPVLVSVTVWAALVVFNVWLANAKLDDDRLTIGAGGTAPVPLSAIVCGLPAASSVMVTDAVRVPVAVGVNVTLMLQFPPFAATELPQLFVCEKSPLFVPATATLVMFSAAFPVFVSVTVCAALVVFKVWLANVTLELERLTAGAGKVVTYPGPPRSNVPNDGAPFVKSTSMYHRLSISALEIGSVFVVVRVTVSITSPESET